MQSPIPLLLLAVSLAVCACLMPACGSAPSDGNNDSGGDGANGADDNGGDGGAPADGDTITNPRDPSMQLRRVPEGDAVFGADDSPYSNERPQFTASLPAYYIGETEVTNAQFARFLNDVSPSAQDEASWINLADDDGSISKAGGVYTVASGRDHHPVVLVTWAGAQAYCGWAGLRLPTELEWEKGARGTDGREYPWGGSGHTDGWDGTRCRHWGNHPGSPPAGTCVITDYASGISPNGLYGMCGNVWEWTADWYDINAYGRYATGDLMPPTDGSYRVARGGGWNGDYESRFRAAYRGFYTPTNSYGYVGFRCARDAEA